MVVDKIQEYLSGTGKKLDEALLDEIGQLAKWSFGRQFGEREEDPKTLRLSSIGRCVRQQAYKILGFETNGKKIDARAKVVFFQGDMAEMAIIGLARAVGLPIAFSGKDQAKIEILGVTGHPDAVLPNCLVEAKSMSSYSFSEFQRGVLDEGYRYQCNAYMHALGLKECVIVALNKDAGVLAEMVISIDPVIVEDILRRIEMLKAVAIDSLPERPYKSNDKGYYPWMCLYCPYHGTCLPDAEKVLVGKAYKLKEKTNDDRGIARKIESIAS